MKIGISLVVVAYLFRGLLAAALPAVPFINPSDIADVTANSPSNLVTLEEMKAQYKRLTTAELKKKGSWAKCNERNVRVRKEW